MDLYEASDMSLDDSGFFGKGVQIQIRVGKIEANSQSKDVQDGPARPNPNPNPDPNPNPNPNPSPNLCRSCCRSSAGPSPSAPG